MATTSKSGEVFGPQQASAFVDEGRWLAEWHWRRGDSYERRAGQLLAYDGLLLGLVLTASPGLRQHIGGASAGSAELLAACLVALLLLSACACLLALLRRSVPGVDIDHVEARWKQYRERGAAPGHVLAAAADELLLPGLELPPPAESVIMALSNDARTRGRAFTCAVAFSVVALFFVAALAMLVITKA